MNRIRRKNLQSIIDKLEDLKSSLEELQEEEEDYRDNMPENLQGSERYDRADEAASNIGVESEELIMNVIHELAKTKTVLLISHRLANVVKSDQIYFLKDGEIKESGKHDELMSQNGAYRHLYESQMALENYGKGGMA